MINLNEINQTELNFEGPIWEDLTQPKPVLVKPTEVMPEIDRGRRRTWLILGSSLFGLVVLIILGLFLLLKTGSKPQVVIDNKPFASAIPTSQTQLELDLAEVNQAIKVADPTLENVVFPPVKSEIGI